MTTAETSRLLAEMVNSAYFLGLPIATQLHFRSTLGAIHSLNDLTIEQRHIVDAWEEETKNNSAHFETEEQLLDYLSTQNMSIKEFMQTPVFLKNEKVVPLFKTLWLRDIFEHKEETPEQPKRDGLPIMVAFYLPPDTAQKLALDCEGACAPEELHVTLMILGDSATLPPELGAKLKEAVGTYAQQAAPVHGHISGVGCFTNTPTESATMPFYASIDIGCLNTWREQLRAALPLPIDETHGFTAHCTLAYISKDAPFPIMNVPNEALLFDTIWLCIGDDKTAFALQGHEQKDN